MKDSWYKNKKTDLIWWKKSDRIGVWEFSFDRVNVFNMFRDYPNSLNQEEKEIFDKENPYRKDFFKDRQ